MDITYSERDLKIIRHFGTAYVHGHVLSTSPLVIYGTEPGRDLPDNNFLGPALPLNRYLRGRRTYFLIGVLWTLESDSRLRALSEQYFPYVAAYPEHVLIYLCNTPGEVRALTERGIRCQLSNHNILVSEDLFRIIPRVDKKYDAVYDAQMAAYKRHYLCTSIESLALIYFFWGDADFSLTYFQQLQPILTQAIYCNRGPTGSWRRLEPRQVAEIMNSSRVGLCLSEIDGAMRASMEYLLCGLPVVTTPNIGGRDEFLDDEYCVTVAPDPEAVAAGVRQLIDARIDPQYIRDTTLHRVRAEREKFFDFVQEIYDQEGAGRRFRDDWPKVYINNLITWHQPPENFLRAANLL